MFYKMSTLKKSKKFLWNRTYLFIFINMSIFILIFHFKKHHNEISDPIFIQKNFEKLPYQFDYPLNFKRTPYYAQSKRPPCLSFGQWIKNQCKNNSNNDYIDYTLYDLVNLFDSNKEYNKIENRYIINGGANDGITLDSLYPLFNRSGYPGIAIELSNEFFVRLQKNLPSNNIKKLNIALEPHTVYRLFVDNKVPFRPFILKVDIDGYDYTVVRSIFIHNSNNSRTQFQPAIVYLEINEKIPPPIIFHTRYRPTYNYKSDHLYGTSITAWTHLLSYELGYVLLGNYDWNNVIFLRYDLAIEFNLLYKFPHNSYDIWTYGYWNRNGRDNKFPWNRNVLHWNDKNKTILTKYRDIVNYFHLAKTFTENVECSYFIDVESIYIEPE